MPIPNNALTMSGKIRGDITQSDRNYINQPYSKPTEGETAKVVNKWLETATPRGKHASSTYIIIIIITVEPRYNEVLGTMKITLFYHVSHYIRVKKQRYIKSWD